MNISEIGSFSNVLALGIVLGFICQRITGLSAGGLIVPGYLAFYLDQPDKIVVTYILAGVIYGLLRLLANVVIIYGQRRFMAAILLSLLLTSPLLADLGMILQSGGIDGDIIGYTIPGIFANNMLKQGYVKTLCVSVIVLVVLRLIILFFI